MFCSITVFMSARTIQRLDLADMMERARGRERGMLIYPCEDGGGRGP